LFHPINGKRHPRDMGAPKVERFFSGPASRGPGGREHAESGAVGAAVSVPGGARCPIAVVGERRSGWKDSDQRDYMRGGKRITDPIEGENWDLNRSEHSGDSIS
jgi:hypothetical protein